MLNVVGRDRGRHGHRTETFTRNEMDRTRRLPSSNKGEEAGDQGIAGRLVPPIGAIRTRLWIPVWLLERQLPEGVIESGQGFRSPKEFQNVENARADGLPGDGRPNRLRDLGEF